MYAIIESGGRQLRVAEGAVIHVDRLDAQIGDEVEFNRVLFVEQETGSFVAGTPYVNGASVSGLVDGQTRGPKIRVFRKRRRKAWRRTLGHRAELTSVRIVRIDA